MKKDITLAILIGLAFGMLAAFIVIFLPTLTKRGQNSQQITANVSPAITQTENNIADITINIKNPPPNSIFIQKSVLLEGNVKNSNLAVLDTDFDTTILSATDSGNFKQELSLSEGSNKFTIVAFDDKGGTASKTFMLYYTPEKI